MPYAKHALDTRVIWSSTNPPGTKPYDLCRCGAHVPPGQIDQHVQDARKLKEDA